LKRIFGVYYPAIGKVYMVPVDEVPPKSGAILRLDATKNNQEKGVKWAKEHEI